MSTSGVVERLEARISAQSAAEQSWSGARAAMRQVEGRGYSVRLATLANALGIIHFDEDQDVLDLQEIVSELGAASAASLQERVLRPIDTREGRPLTTALVRNLGHRAWGRASRTPGSLTHESLELREVCSEAAHRLLVIDDGGDGPVPVLQTEQDVIKLFHEDHVVHWRRLIAAALDQPWSGRNEVHLTLVDPDRRPGEFEGVRQLIAKCRQIVEEDERRAVADHIRSTIATTGLKQREFAALVGTSPSRLSTYVAGSVTPSAAMLLRINRMAGRHRAAQAPERLADS
ncbi:helix-turn-helix transcriptional regulator [Nocardioides humilatus]|uniref:Helix-turn-helix transcriptional regulator n=1 Tax=Nocardioides humilatus TaxID=2607660 RepID=A0A5B1L842_9ACTN|nr:helix-turn-helix transcriptional regulator [Nocardioides humilatus]KAA1415857.1 helix-turn-helix transcriptional regulator [Nocardioides humilatus]